MSDAIRILVVDDEVDLERLMLQQMRREIRRNRYEFEFVYNGEEALERLQANSDIDIVLSDINMPKMDGLALLRQIAEADHDLRAVVVSAYGDMKNIRTAMNHGAFDFVIKPIDFDDLKVTIERTAQDLERWREAQQAHDRFITIQHELGVAQSMQQSILPHEFPTTRPHTDHYDIHANMEAARSVGGDYYDVYTFDDERFGLVIADVSDKGVPAAMFMMSSHSLMRAYAASGDSPAEVLLQTNQKLLENNEGMTFVTLFYGIYDANTHELSYANAGHNSPLLVHPDQTTELLESTEGVALGVAENFEFQEKTITLKPGSTLVMYTDGVTEAEHENGEQFEMKRLQELFDASEFDTAKEATDAVFNAVREFVSNSPQSDDITCLVLRTGTQTDAPPPTAPERKTMALPNRLGGIRTIAAFLSEFAKQHGLSDKMMLPIHLSVEEVFTNIVSYAYDDEEDHEIQFTYWGDRHSITIELMDDGKPFDPLQNAPEADLDSSLEERRIGGVGIVLAKKMMSDLHYERKEGRNCLTLVKKF